MRSFITGRAPSIMVRCPKLLQVSEVFDSINTSFLKSPLLVNLNSSFFPFIHVKFVLAQYVLLDSTRSDGGSASAVWVSLLLCPFNWAGRVATTTPEPGNGPDPYPPQPIRGAPPVFAASGPHTFSDRFRSMARRSDNAPVARPPVAEISSQISSGSQPKSLAPNRGHCDKQRLPRAD